MQRFDETKRGIGHHNILKFDYDIYMDRLKFICQERFNGQSNTNTVNDRIHNSNSIHVASEHSFVVRL